MTPGTDIESRGKHFTPGNELGSRDTNLIPGIEIESRDKILIPGIDIDSRDKDLIPGNEIDSPRCFPRCTQGAHLVRAQGGLLRFESIQPVRSRPSECVARIRSHLGSSTLSCEYLPYRATSLAQPVATWPSPGLPRGRWP